ncbi:MAG: hypothetical protein AAFW47_05575 [Pseudomonadota bacterium]
MLTSDIQQLGTQDLDMQQAEMRLAEIVSSETTDEAFDDVEDNFTEWCLQINPQRLAFAVGETWSRKTLERLLGGRRACRRIKSDLIDRYGALDFTAEPVSASHVASLTRLCGVMFNAAHLLKTLDGRTLRAVREMLGDAVASKSTFICNPFGSGNGHAQPLFSKDIERLPAMLADDGMAVFSVWRDQEVRDGRGGFANLLSLTLPVGELRKARVLEEHRDVGSAVFNAATKEIQK